MTSWHPNRGDDSPTTTSAILGVDKQDMIMPKQRRNWGLIIAIIVSGVLLGGIGAAGVSIYQHVTNTTTALGSVATTTPATATSAGNNVPYAARSGRSGNPTVTVTATATPEPQAEARTATQRPWRPHYPLHRRHRPRYRRGSQKRAHRQPRRSTAPTRRLLLIAGIPRR